MRQRRNRWDGEVLLLSENRVPEKESVRRDLLLNVFLCLILSVQSPEHRTLCSDFHVLALCFARESDFSAARSVDQGGLLVVVFLDVTGVSRGKVASSAAARRDRSSSRVV